MLLAWLGSTSVFQTAVAERRCDRIADMSPITGHVGVISFQKIYDLIGQT